MATHTILFMAADPAGTDARALDLQARAIQEALERSGLRDRFRFETRWAAQPLDLLRDLVKLKPTVVHFCGGRLIGQSAGAPAAGVYFQAADGRGQLVAASALAQAFDATGSVRLVVLDACYSDAHAAAVAAHIDCVVGMSGETIDGAATNFSSGLYGGLGEGEPVAAAVRQGRAAIALMGLGDSEQPHLVTRSGVNASQLVLTAPPIRPSLQAPVVPTSMPDDRFDGAGNAPAADAAQTEPIEDAAGWRLAPTKHAPEAGTRGERDQDPSGNWLRRGFWGELAGVVLISGPVAVWSTMECLSFVAHGALKILVALGAGLLGGTVVGGIRGVRRHAGTLSPSFLARTNIHAASAAVSTVVAGTALIFAGPRPDSRCATAVEAKAPEDHPNPSISPDGGASKVQPPPPPIGMVYVAAGSFRQGTDKVEEQFDDCRNAYGDACGWQTFERERQHAGPVDVPGFFLDEHEVTNAQLATFMARLHAAGEAQVVPDVGMTTAGSANMRLLVRFGFAGDERFKEHPYTAFTGDGTTVAPIPGMADRPAVLISWDLAARYCRSQGKRLPSETEWEYAARGPEARGYVWDARQIRCRDVAYGRLALSQGNASIECGSEEKRPNAVGTAELDRSWCGAADLGVNVSEWVADAFVDPKIGCPAAVGPPDSTEAGLCHVYKGGNWVEPLRFSRPAYRPVAQPRTLFTSIGFRCAASLKGKP